MVTMKQARHPILKIYKLKPKEACMVREGFGQNMLFWNCPK